MADIIVEPVETPLLQAAGRTRGPDPRRARDAGPPGGGRLRDLDRPPGADRDDARGRGGRPRAAVDSQNVLYLSHPAADGGESRSFSEVTVALQGTLETFALPDVLRLLASTHKTGRLRLTGAGGLGFAVARRRGHRGQRGQSAPRSPTAPSDVLFELLRFKEGDFVFDDDERPDGGRRPGRRRGCARLGRGHARGVEVDRGRRAVARRLGVVAVRPRRRRGDPRRRAVATGRRRRRRRDRRASWARSSAWPSCPCPAR